MIEHSNFSGGVVGVGRRPVFPTAMADRKSNSRFSRMRQPAIEGWAALYNQPHIFKGNVDVFAKGAFDSSLASGKGIRFQFDHQDDLVLGSTDDRLELRSDERGLAFRFLIDDERLLEMVESKRLDAVSVGYSLLPSDYEMKSVDGDAYRLINKVDLNEISLVERGAVKQSYATVVDAAVSDPLAVQMKSASFSSEGAYRRLMRELQDTK